MRPNEARGLLVVVMLLGAVTIAGLAYSWFGQRERTEVLSELLPMALSDDHDTQVASLGAASRFLLEDKLDPDTYLLFVERARVSADDGIRQRARESLWQVSQELGHKRDVETALRRRPAFVDLRTKAGANPELVRHLADGIKHDASADGPLMVGYSFYDVVPDQPEIRCFAKDCEKNGLISEIAEYLRSRGISASAADRTSLVRQTTPYTNVIEIWVPPDRLKRDGNGRAAGAK